MTEVAGIEALVILILLLAALLYGQLAAAQQDRAQISSQATEVARYRSTVSAYPAATARRP